MKVNNRKSVFDGYDLFGDVSDFYEPTRPIKVVPSTVENYIVPFELDEIKRPHQKVYMNLIKNNPHLLNHELESIVKKKVAARKERNRTKQRDRDLDSMENDKMIKEKRRIKHVFQTHEELFRVDDRNLKNTEDRRDFRKKVRVRPVKKDPPAEPIKEVDIISRYTKEENKAFREDAARKRQAKRDAKLSKMVVQSINEAEMPPLEDDTDCIVRNDYFLETIDFKQAMKDIEEVFEQAGLMSKSDIEKSMRILYDFRNDPRYHTQAVSIKDCLSSRVDSALGIYTTEWLEWIFDFVDMLQMVVIENVTRMHKIRYLGLWLRLQGFRTLESRSIAWFIGLVISDKKDDDSVVKTQAVSDELDKIGDVLEYVFDSSFADAVKNLFIGAALMKRFDKETAHWIFDHLGTFPTKLPFYDLLRICIKSLARVVKAMEDMASGVPMVEALFKKDSWIHAKTMFTTLTFQRDHLYVGLKVDGKFPKAVWLKQVSETLSYLKAKQKTTSQLKGKAYLDIVSMVTKLEEMQSEVIASMNAGVRPAPFGVIIGEDPGIGKSNLIRLNSFIYCMIKGYKYTDDLVYHIDSTSEYHEGLENQVIYHYSEPGTATKKIAETRGDPKVMEITSVIDSVAKRANMAELSKKANTYFAPELVIVDTNNMGMNLEHMVMNKAAFKRRFRYTKFTVLDQFRKEGSCEVDWKKVVKGGGHPLDIYSIDVWKEVATSVSNSRPAEQHTHMNIFEYVEWFKQEIGDHLAGQDYILKQLENDKMFSHWAPEEKGDDNNSEAGSEGSEDYAATVLKSSIFGKIAGKVIDANTVLKKKITDVFLSGESKTSEKILENIPLRNMGKDFYDDNFSEPSIDMDPSDTEHVEFVPPPMSNNLEREEKLNIGNYQTQAGDDDTDVFNYNIRIKQDIDETNMKIKVGGVLYLYLRPNHSLMVPVGYIRKYVQKHYGMPVMFATDEFKIDIMTDGDDVSSTSYPAAFPMGEEKKTNNGVMHYLYCAMFYIWWTADILWSFFCSYLTFTGQEPNYLKWIKAVLSIISIIGVFLFGWIYVIVWFFSLGCNFADYTDKRSRSALNIVHKAVKLKKFLCGDRVTLVLSSLVAVVGVVGVGSFVWDAYSKRKGHSVKVEQCNEFLKTVEEKSECTPGVARINIRKHGEIWNQKISPRVPSLHTGDPESLSVKVNSNVRMATWDYTNTLGKRCKLRGYALGVKSDYVIVPRHYFSMMPELVVVTLEGVRNGLPGGAKREVRLRREDIVEISTDLVVFRTLTSQFHDILEHFCCDDGAPEGSAFIRTDNTKAIRHNAPLTVENLDSESSYQLDKYYRYPSTLVAGDCGWPLIMQRDKGSAIVGIHVAGNIENGKINSVADCIYRKDLERAITLLSTTFAQCLSLKPDPTLTSPEPIVLSDLEMPISKSALCHEHLPLVSYYGRLPGSVMAKSHSRLKYSIFSEDLEFVHTFRETFGSMPSVRFTRPLMEGKNVNGDWISPVNNWFKKINHYGPGIDRRVLRKSIDCLLKHTVDGLAAKGVTKLTPNTFEEAINGTPEDAFFTRINASTAGGFGYSGKKSKHLPFERKDIRECSAELQKELENIIKSFEKEECVHFVYNAALKDEPRAVDKVKKGNTRVFYVSPLSALILSRMYLGPLYSLMVQFSDLFMCSVGINMHRQGGKLFKDLEAFSKFIIEGDWKTFDIDIPVEISAAVNTYIIEFFRKMGYTEYALKIVSALLAEALIPFVAFLMDVMMIPGIQPSGKYGTAENNCLKNVMLVLVYWFSHPVLKDMDFFTYVMLRVYGDDLLKSVKPEVTHMLNANSFSLFAMAEYRMTFTDAQKSTDMRDFVTIDECSFLKRKYARHPETGIEVAPIDIDTIFKMLEWVMPSDFVSPAEQMAMTIESALRESFFHLPREKYDVWRSYLKRVYEDKYGISRETAARFVQYDYLLDFYFAEPETLGDAPIESKDCTTESVNLCEAATVLDPVVKLDKIGVVQEKLIESCITEKRQRSEEFIKTMEETFLQLELELKESENNDDSLDLFPGMSYADAKRTSEYASNNEIRKAVDKYYLRKAEQNAISLTMKHITSAITRHKNNTRFIAQSKNEAVSDVGPVDSSNIDPEQNLTDIGGEPEAKYEAGRPLKMASSSEFSLESYLKRPILILTSSIALNADYEISFNPWSVIMSDPTIISKLRNYAYLRADLVVKLAISCSQFEYGTFQGCYVPMYYANDVSAFYIGGLPAAYRYQRIQWMSQQRGAFLMRLHDNKPVEIKIPYIQYAPLLRLFNNSAAATATYSDVAEMGSVIMLSLNKPLSVNSTAPTNLSLNVYAHLDNVDLGVTTGTQVVVTTESANEYRTGPLEKMSTALADASGILEDIPIIAPYAKASSTVFRALSALAAHYGFSVPTFSPSDHHPMHMRPDAFQNSALCMSVFMGKKMSYDPHQEIAVDPRLVGEVQDELSMSYMCSRQSLLDTFTWNVSAIPMSTILWRTYVAPRTNKLGAISAGFVYVQPTSLAFAAAPYEAWRGTVKYKFFVNKSFFHKAKIGIMFEPNVNQSTLITSTLHLNKQYILVVDLQETDTFEICIPFMHHRFWATCPSEQSANRSMGAAFTSATGINTPDNFTGFITVFPFTALQGPDAASVDFNVYQYSDDMQFNNLTMANVPTSRVTTQSANDASAEDYSCFILGEEVLDKSYKSLFHYGEQPTSFRSYLKRYTTTYVASATMTTSLRASLYILPEIIDPWASVGGNPINLFSYLRYAFLGWRGSLRKRVRLTGTPYYATNRVTVSMERLGVAPTGITTATVPYSIVDERPNAMFVPGTNGGIEVEIPFYNQNLFMPSGKKNTTLPFVTDTNFDKNFPVTYNVDFDTVSGSTGYVVEETCIGEDFSFIRYLGATPYRTSSY